MLKLKRLLLAALLSALCSLAVAQNPKVPSMAEVQAARERVQNDTELTEEERARRVDGINRIEIFLNAIDEFRERKASYASARENARQQAADLQRKLESEIAAYEGKEPAPPPGTPLAEVEQEIQSSRADVAALEARANQLAESLKAETGRPEKIRKDIAAKTVRRDELAAATAVAEGGDSASASQLKTWLTAVQDDALAAEIAMLEEELLSRPMRLDLMNAQQDRTAFDLLRVRARIKAYDEYAISQRQAEAQQVLTEAESTQQALAGKHPLVRELARENTALTTQITARATTLENVRSAATAASETARRFETDLENIQRKLQVLGMSQALGRVLREQQQRLPVRMRSRAELDASEKEVSDSSLRQLEYEDERRLLRNRSAYIEDLTAGLPAEEATAISDDLAVLVETRRDLINRAIDIETTYLRALGELDFERRRAASAAEAYRSFISERLLWIRSADPFSLDMFKPLPGEVAQLLLPARWWNLLIALPAALLSSVIYPLMLALFVVLLVYDGRLSAVLRETGRGVGNVTKDKFSSTLGGLLATALVALKWPLLAFTAGAALRAYELDGLFELTVADALTEIALYFYGLEFIRHLLSPEGLLRRHFLWRADTVKGINRQLWLLELVFVPALVLAIIANRAIEKEGQGILTTIAIILTLLALSRFFLGMPRIISEGLRSSSLSVTPRRALLGRAVRVLLTALPIVLIVAVGLGYIHTAIEFLRLLIHTLALIVALLLAHELGVRWLRILRLRLIARERQAAREAARQAQESQEGRDPDYIDVDFEEPDPDSLDQAGRNLLNAMLAVAVLLGIWAIWSGVLPALNILDRIELWSITEMVDGVEKARPVTPVDIIQVLLVTFVGYVIIQRVPALLELFLRQRLDLPPGTVYAGVTLFRYILIGVVTVVVLGSLGAHWSSIQWAVAALSVGIGFGLQEIVANFISGLILLFEQPIRVGDTVTVGDTSGVVTKIRMRATTVRDWDGRELLVPNKEFITGRLLNWSLSDTQTRVVIEIGIAYGSDVPQAMKLALDAAKEQPDILNDPEPFITFDAFGDNSLLLRLRAYLPKIDRRLIVSSLLREAINQKYNEAGIVIAFPQRDVHLNTLAPLEVLLLDGQRAAASET